ncbi:MAG: FHA domain-containing protein [Oscillospiraceae bacterium]|jgi:hypothetical protein|nr:FHA domain-containing protein [Oscillospiraceae bacterium]
MNYQSYEIDNKCDFMTGMSIVTKIPAIEVDKNALFTMQVDKPEFTLPFHYKKVNGDVEFTYKVGILSKLQYFAGEVSPKDYISLWQSILKPLLVCGDWFMNPHSFLLDIDYLYYDKIKKIAVYLYIPSVRKSSGLETFNSMVTKISKLFFVSDTTLENIVLRAIVNDFSPSVFLNALNEYGALQDTDKPKQPASNMITEVFTASNILTESKSSKDSSVSYNRGLQSAIDEAFADEEIDTYEDIIDEIKGNETSDIEDSAIDMFEKEPESYKLFSRKSSRKKKPHKEFESQLISPEEPLHKISTVVAIQADTKDETQEAKTLFNGVGFRCIGRAELPQIIDVKIAEGEIFSIGRYDSSLGKQQSSFEFDRKTKAVSRRHAIIERNENGYFILDLSSSAGTYVNKKRLPPNIPHELEEGYNVSFGNLGADYVWESN